MQKQHIILLRIFPL